MTPAAPRPRRPALTPPMLIRAYSAGYFPMAEHRRGRLHWYSPDPRAILPLDPPQAFHVPHGLRRRLRRAPFVITFDRAFARVIRACAAPRPKTRDTWISDQIIRAYTQLHRLGLAHSVEAWLPPEAPPAEATPPQPDVLRGVVLAGGLYGVALGGAFFGESMFTRVTDASKVCLVRLVERLRARGYMLLDTQIDNPHMAQFGTVEIPRPEYLRRLAAALALPVTWD